MNRFVIITPGRSGSTFLAQTFNQHPEIFCEEEIFNRSENYDGSFNHYLSTNFFRRSLSFLFNRERLSRSPANFPLRVLLAQFLKSKRKHEAIYGFKVSLDQLFAYPQLFPLLRSSFEIIYLTRLDKLRVVLSLLASRKTGTYDTYTEEKVRLSPGEVKTMLEEIDHQEQQTKAFFSQRLEIAYRDLFNNPAATFRRIEGFLSLDNPLEPIPTKQVRPDNLAEWVENIDEIEMYLKTSN